MCSYAYDPKRTSGEPTRRCKKLSERERYGGAVSELLRIFV